MDFIMDSPIIFLLIGLAVLTLLAALWYLFQTVRIIWGYNSLLAIASVIFSPFIHIFFYFMPKDEFSKHEAGLFKKYFLSIGLVALVGIMAAMLIPATMTEKPIESISNKEIETQENMITQGSANDEELAAQGDASAQFRLGRMYLNGDGVNQDYAKAFEWYQKSANQGNNEAQTLMGHMYYDGKGVNQDYTKAFEWFQKAANQGQPLAQIFLGFMYYDGEGVRQDYAKAFEWFQKAANQGVNEAQSRLGKMYSRGEGVRQDYAKAAEWHRKSANQGNTTSQMLLGFMLATGDGVQQNESEAKEWFGKACDRGVQDGCEMYKELNQSNIK